MKFKKKSNKPKNKTRKELRKEKRKEKKIRKQEYFSKKKKTNIKDESENINIKTNRKIKSVKTEKKITQNKNYNNQNNEIVLKNQNEKKKEIKLEKEMKKHRKHVLTEENEKEDKLIKSLEKQLKLNKRKSNNIPKSFVEDGLDYLLELCDTETLKQVASVEKQLNNSNLESDFEEDFAIAIGKKASAGSKSEKRKKKTPCLETNKSESDDENNLNSSDEYSEDECISEDEISNPNLDNTDEEGSHFSDENNYSDDSCLISSRKKKKVKFADAHEIDQSSDANRYESDESTQEKDADLLSQEDIYGRKRDNQGNLIESQEKYIPPAVRARMIAEKNMKSDFKSLEKLSRLQKQMKGFLNRLAESNLISIGSQIEQLYNSNSRHDMNTTLTKLVFEALISPVLTPFRQVADYALLIALLHANVDTEVGANFLQNITLKFHKIANQEQPVENKELENIVHIISQLYNLKVFQAQLLHEFLWHLLKFNEDHNSGVISERCVECALLILRTTGPTLRKDDPLALRDTILKMQTAVSTVPTTIKESSRFKFLLDLLMAIKNNNFTKIPNYNPDYIEHLRKVLRAAIRKGNSVVQLNISYDDLLRAEEKGRWWVVGSAWAGQDIKKDRAENVNELKPVHSQKLLDLAQKQRMNTDIRKNIFCILMSAEDYLDAFEKLLKLGLRPQQEREVVHVILHCILQETKFNPYYALIMQKFCDYDRKYQMGIQFAVWDKLKELNNCTSDQITNLAKLLTHLFLQGGLPLSALKVIQLSELDKPLLRLLRQTLLGVLLSDDAEASVRVWERIAPASSLRQFRQGLRVFIHHFLLKNSVMETLLDKDKELLKQRAKTAEKYLAASEQKVTF